MEPSKLESEADNPGRFAAIVDQMRQYREEGAYFGHYAENCLKILIGKPPTDYRVISHENKVIRSEFVRR